MNEPLLKNPEYIQGQIDALHALVLAVAQELPSAVFRDNALARLQAIRNVLINQHVGDARIAAVDAASEWAKTLS